jgi:hypothetical protein
MGCELSVEARAACFLFRAVLLQLLALGNQWPHFREKTLE